MKHTMNTQVLSMTKPEKQVQSEIMKYVRSYGWYCVKIIKGNENGISDLLMCIAGKFISVEVKAEKFVNDPWKQASAWQKVQLARVQQAGGQATVVASLEQFKLEFSDWVEKTI